MAIVTKTIGATGRDYSNFAVATAGINTDLTAPGDTLNWVLYNDAILTSNAVTIAATGFDNTGTLNVYAAAGHFNGIPGDGFRLQSNGSIDQLTFGFLAADCPTVNVSDIEFIGFGAIIGVSRSLRINEDGTSPHAPTINRIIIHGWAGASTTVAIFIAAGVDNAVIQNVLIYGNTTALAHGIATAADGTDIRNVTIVDCATSGVLESAVLTTKPLCRNCVCLDNGTDYSGTMHASSDYNADVDGSATGANSITVAQSDEFRSTAAANFLLKTSGQLMRSGTVIAARTTDIRKKGVHPLKPNRGCYSNGPAGVMVPVIL